MSCKNRTHFIALLLAIPLLGLSPARGLAQIIHLHDSDSEQLARETLQNLNTLETPESSMFQNMLRNLDAAHQRSLAVLWERGQATLASRVDKIVEWNWNTFTQEVQASESEFIAAYEKAVLARKESALGLDHLAAGINAAEAEIRAAKEELAHHDAGEREVSRAIEHYESAVGEIQKIAADQDLAKKLKNFQLDKMQGYLRKLQDLAKKADTKAGLRPLYLDLGLSLAILEIDELKAEFEYRRWAQSAVEDRVGRLMNIVGNRGADGAIGPKPIQVARPSDDGAGNSDRGVIEGILQTVRPNGALHGENAFGAQGDELIMATLERLARKAHQETISQSTSGPGDNFNRRYSNSVALRDLLDRLASYASIVGYQKFLLEADENEDNFQSRRESILLTQIEDRKLDILLAHALQGLLAYQGGGVRPMEILNMAGGLRP